MTIDASTNGPRPGSLFQPDIQLCLAALQDDMAAVESGIGLGIIIPEVYAARLLALAGRGGDEPGDGEHVLGFPADLLVEQLVHDVLAPEADDLDGLIESRPMAFD